MNSLVAILLSVSFSANTVYSSSDYVPIKVEVPQYGNVKIFTEFDLQKYDGYDVSDLILLFFILIRSHSTFNIVNHVIVTCNCLLYSN